MSSSIKDQTVDGYVSEFANAHNVSPMIVMQTAMFKEFIASMSDRDAAEKGEVKKCLD